MHRILNKTQKLLLTQNSKRREVDIKHIQKETGRKKYLSERLLISFLLTALQNDKLLLRTYLTNDSFSVLMHPLFVAFLETYCQSDRIHCKASTRSVLYIYRYTNNKYRV